MNTKTQDFLQTIQQIHQRLIEAKDFPQDLKDIAIKAAGVPVYQDMGGVLLLALDGSILHHDPEVDQLDIVEEERWKIVALVQAAKNFPGWRCFFQQSQRMPLNAMPAMARESCSRAVLVVFVTDRVGS